MRIYARNTEIKEIEPQEAYSFIEETHRDGLPKKFSSPYPLALLNKEQEIVAVALFCNPRAESKAKRYSAELLRLAFKQDLRVVGGASKLLKHFMNNSNKPADFFTDQDTSGEATDVYELSGMKLVSENKLKDYLVAPGKTLKTGSRKEVIEMAYATRYGPDRILGTNLGEVFDETGKKKSNKLLFIEDLGWHIETKTGDRTYEWVNPERTFYTYKITATDSDKYYYGVSHVKKANATAKDCLNDGYYGSGGQGGKNKFRNWKEKHGNNLQKEIIARFSLQAEAFDLEKRLIGNLWKEDLNCLNGCTGGKTGGLNARRSIYELRVCRIHGETKHQGNTCSKCSVKAISSVKNCEEHGLTAHRGDSCYRCSIEKVFSVGQCSIHGKTSFRGKYCAKCMSKEMFSKRVCHIHGKTNHIGNACLKCKADDAHNQRECSIHGETTHAGSSCLNCQNNKTVSIKTCAIHGETKHQGNTCSKCASKKLRNLRECPIHGLVDHMNDVCSTCNSQKSVNLKQCVKVADHGVTKHQGDTCCKCSVASSYALKECVIHGETKFAGETCMKCTAAKTLSIKTCSIHGESKHKKDKCLACVMVSTIKECKVHGMAKHRGNSCYKCRFAKKS